MLLYVLTLIGGAVFAISGALAAGRKGLDWVGVIVLAGVTAIGGGTLRDLLLDRTIFWIEDPTHLWVILAASVLTILYCRWFKPITGTLRAADALGLAMFAILGAQVAEAEGVAPIIVVAMGVLTGTAGGVIRDTLAGEIPMLFRAGEPIYSIACVAGLVGYLGFKAVGMEPQWAALVGVFIIAALRFVAIAMKIRLPAFHANDDQGG